MRVQVLIIFFIIGFYSSVFGQEFSPDLSSPHNTVFTHLHFLQANSYALDSSALAFDVEDPKRARQLALRLKQVLDGKGLFVKMTVLPKEANYTDSLGVSRYVLFPKSLPEVYLERKSGFWYYSAETVESMDYLHKQVYPFGTDLLLKLSPRFGQQKVLGLALWQYFGVLLLIFLAFIFHRLLSFTLKFIFQVLSNTRLGKISSDPTLIRRIARKASLVLITVLIGSLLPLLHLPVKIAQFAFIVVSIFKTVFIVLLILRVLDLLFFYIRKLANDTKSTLDDQLLPIVIKISKAVFIIIGVINVLSLMKVNVTALIAGVSIGGLAIALAAQDTVKNLIGSLVIFIDAPFQIGDYVKLGAEAGVVEEVGFRSTRLRTSDTSLISIPNGKVADMVINNLGVRKFRRFHLTLSLHYDTSPDSIEIFIEGLRELIESQPEHFTDNYQVYLNGFADASLSVLFNSYLDIDNSAKELAVKQEILLAILQLAKTLGIRFAFPSSALFIEDASKQKAAGIKEESPVNVERKKMIDFIAALRAKRKKN